jgi:hypothetical protein
VLKTIQRISTSIAAKEEKIRCNCHVDLHQKGNNSATKTFKGFPPQLQHSERKKSPQQFCGFALKEGKICSKTF